MERQISRREFLIAGGALTVASLAGAVLPKACKGEIPRGAERVETSRKKPRILENAALFLKCGIKGSYLIPGSSIRHEDRTEGSCK